MINKSFLAKKLKHTAVSICSVAILFSMLSLPSLAAENDSGQSQIMVSLGDSYSSGEGIEPFYGQEKDISDKIYDYDWLAHRSQNSWPGMLTLPAVNGTMAENRNSKWFFMAASGAVTSNLNEKQTKEYKNGKYSGSKDLEPQLNVFDELGDKKTDYVTLTLGGNDADFSGVITEVVIGSTYLNISGLSDKLNNTWKEFYKQNGICDNLRNSYKEIAKQAGSQAQIIVAGYPKLLEPSGRGFFVSKDEALMVNTAVSNFNNAIERIVNQTRDSGIKICFVSVEDAFEGHEAYSDDPYINEVIFGKKSEDLKNFDIASLEVASSYSVHPNYKGACAYANCVQKKIDEIEAAKSVENENTSNEIRNDTDNGGISENEKSDERDIVLVLDTSGSMDGKPIEETKKAATKFVDTILQDNASIGIVNYDDDSTVSSPFSNSKSSLESVINALNTGGSTNIEAGLRSADQMLSQSSAKKKIIVLMSDGEPNKGLVGDSLISYADELKEKGIYIYTLGFFESIGDKTKAQTLMEKIASEGCHYEVSDADSLVFFFGDIADQINGQKYIYVRIACPVDVSVTFNGETLDSSDAQLNTRTSFGSLTFEQSDTQADSYSYSSQSDSGGYDDRVKILRLKEGENYDIRIEGTARGRMNYSIGFMDENGEYSDFRKFKNIKIKKNTLIDTVANVSDKTVLNVDEDGDGKYDLTYQAEANGNGKLVDYSYIIYIIVAAAVVLIILITVLVIRGKLKKRKQYKNI